MPMSKEEMLARIQESAKNMKETPDLSPEVVRQIQAAQANKNANGWSLPIAPPKPDPEAAANDIIQDHINQMKAQQVAPTPAAHPGDVQQAMQAKAQNGINPETGMPYYSPQAQVDPADAARQQQNQFKLQYLQQKAAGGQ